MNNLEGFSKSVQEVWQMPTASISDLGRSCILTRLCDEDRALLAEVRDLLKGLGVNPAPSAGSDPVIIVNGSVGV